MQLQLNYGHHLLVCFIAPVDSSEQDDPHQSEFTGEAKNSLPSAAAFLHDQLIPCNISI